MNIQEISGLEIEKLASDINKSTVRHLQEFAEQKKEEALLDELRRSGKPKKDKVLEYLQRTQRKTVRNQYVSSNLWIDTFKLKKIRQELAAEGNILVEMRGGVIHLRLLPK
jgi:hypothetical protein